MSGSRHVCQQQHPHPAGPRRQHPGDYLNDHPVGNNAIVSCGGAYNWDCTMTAPAQSSGPEDDGIHEELRLLRQPKAYNNTPTVQCTTCHNQHLMNVVKVTTSPNSGLPAGNYGLCSSFGARIIRPAARAAPTRPHSSAVSATWRSHEMNGGNTFRPPSNYCNY